MTNLRTLALLLALGLSAACTAAGPTTPSVESGRPLPSSLIGSGNETPPDSLKMPPPGDDTTPPGDSIK